MVNLLEDYNIKKFLHRHGFKIHFDTYSNDGGNTYGYSCFLINPKFSTDTSKWITSGRHFIKNDGGVFVEIDGRGATATEAFNTLCSQLSGRTIVFINDRERKEYTFPLIIQEA